MTREVNAAMANREWHFLGFSDGDVGPPPAGAGIYGRVTWVGAPYWLFALVTATLAASTMSVAIKARRQHRRSAQGCCPGCGYDLRATPERCPECGLVANVMN